MIKIPVTHAMGIHRVRGLIASDKPESLLLRTRFGIHTFGVKFPIDVVILDTRNRVVKLKEKLMPNHIFFWNPRFNQVIELPLGTIDKKKISLGNVIQLEVTE